MTTTTIVLTVLLSAAPQATRPEPVTTTSQFQAAEPVVRRLTLNQLAGHQLELPVGTTMALIALGMSDDDPGVRLTAVSAAAGRAGALRFGGASMKDRWTAERSEILRLRPALIKIMGDPDPRVRQTAIIALVNVEYEGGPSLNVIGVKPDFADALVARFKVEPKPNVRGEIMKTAALTSSKGDQLRNLLVAGIADPQDRVVAYSLVGLARLRPKGMVPQVAVLLGRPDRNVRLQAAQALAAFGPDAVPFIEQVERALETESDATVKRTLEGTLAALQSIKQKDWKFRLIPR